MLPIESTKANDELGGVTVAIIISDAKIKLAKVGGACAAVGLIVGIVGTLFFANYNPPDKGVPENASVVFGRIVEQNELVSVSQDYNIVDKQSDSSSFFGLFDLPLRATAFGIATRER